MAMAIAMAMALAIALAVALVTLLSPLLPLRRLEPSARRSRRCHGAVAADDAIDLAVARLGFLEGVHEVHGHIVLRVPAADGEHQDRILLVGIGNLEPAGKHRHRQGGDGVPPEYRMVNDHNNKAAHSVPCHSQLGFAALRA